MSKIKSILLFIITVVIALILLKFLFSVVMYMLFKVLIAVMSIAVIYYVLYRNNITFPRK